MRLNSYWVTGFSQVGFGYDIIYATGSFSVASSSKSTIYRIQLDAIGYFILHALAKNKGVDSYSLF